MPTLAPVVMSKVVYSLISFSRDQRTSASRTDTAALKPPLNVANVAPPTVTVPCKGYRKRSRECDVKPIHDGRSIV